MRIILNLSLPRYLPVQAIMLLIELVASRSSVPDDPRYPPSTVLTAQRGFMAASPNRGRPSGKVLLGTYSDNDQSAMFKRTTSLAFLDGQGSCLVVLLAGPGPTYSRGADRVATEPHTHRSPLQVPRSPILSGLGKRQGSLILDLTLVYPRYPLRGQTDLS